MLSSVAICLTICLGLTARVLVLSCPQDFCHRVDCLPREFLNCENDDIVAHGGVCGCCDVCVTLIDEGERCVFPPGAPISRCNGDDLFCNLTSQLCETKTCAMTRQELVERMGGGQDGQFPVGLTLPRCDEDGSYAPVQCSGSVCFCTNKDGERLSSPNEWAYQTHVWLKHTMDCGCARDEDEYIQSGQSGRRFQCTAHGSY